MSKQTSLFLTQDIINTGQFFVFGETGITKPIAIGGPNDSIVKSINVYNSSISGNFVLFYLNAHTGNNLNFSYPIFNLQVPAGAGSGSAVAIDVFSTTGLPSLPIDNAGKRYYPLSSGAQIRAQIMHNVSTGNFGGSGVPPTGMLSITSIIENY